MLSSLMPRVISLDKLSSGYDQIWRAFDQLTADFSADERRKMFHDNAARFYRL